MKRRTILLGTLVGIAIGTAAGLRAQQNGLAASGGAVPPPSTPKTNATDVQFKGDTGTMNTTPQGRIATLSGNVRIWTSEATLKTAAATYNDTTKIAVSPGRVQIDDPQNTVIGDRGTAAYKTKIAEITGNVKINARPKPSNQSAPEGSLRREFKDPANLTCDKVIYNWRTRVATIPGKIVVKQKNRTVTADKAVYDGREERVTLTGNVHLVDTDGSDYYGDDAIIVLREGAESLRVTNPHGKSRVEDEDIPPPSSPASTKP